MLLFRLTDTDDSAVEYARGPRGLLDFDWFDTHGGNVPSVAQRDLSNGLLMPPSGPEDPLWSLARPGLPQPSFGPRWPFGGFPYPAGSAPFPGYPSISMPGATPAAPTFGAGVHASANLPVQADRPLSGHAPFQTPAVRGLASLLMDDEAAPSPGPAAADRDALRPPHGRSEPSGDADIVLAQADGSQTRPSLDYSLDAIERNFRAIVPGWRKQNLPHAATNLEWYLDGSGATRLIDRDEARQMEPIREAEEINGSRFESAFLLPEAERGHLRKLETLADGQTITVTDHWDKDYGNFDFAKQVIDPATRDFALAFGNSKFKSKGKFDVTRDGDEILIDGTVTHDWSDRYDFQPERYMGQGGFLAKGAQALEQYRGAKPFATNSSWTRRIKGKIQIDNGKLTNPEFEWEDVD